jgi:hypothetical protein
MALETTINSVSASPIEPTTGFPFNVPFFDIADIVVTVLLTQEDGPKKLTYTDDIANNNNSYFSIEPTNGDTALGAEITIGGNGYGAGSQVVIERVLQFTQQYDLQEGSSIDPTALNKALDRMVAQNQQQEVGIAKAISFPATDSGVSYEVTQSPTARAGKALGFDSDGNISELSLVDAGGVAVSNTKGLVISGGIIEAKTDGVSTSFGSGGNIIVKDGGVTTEKLAVNAVTSPKILDDAVNTSKILNKNVTFAKIQDISSTRVLGRVSSGIGTAEELVLDTNLDTTSNSHDTLASAKAIKAYVDGLTYDLEYVAVTGGTTGLYQTGSGTYTFNIEDFIGTDLDTDEIRWIHIEAYAFSANGSVNKVSVTYPDGTSTILCEAYGDNSDDDGGNRLTGAVPINKNQTSFQLVNTGATFQIRGATQRTFS